MDGGAWWAAVHAVAKSRTRLSDFHFHALEKEMAAHSSVLAWRIPGTGGSGGLPSMGLHRVGHDWSDLAAAAAVFHYTPTHTHTHLYHMFIIHSSVDGHLVCFYILAVVNNAAIKNIGMHGSFQISVFVPFRYIPRRRVVGSYSSSVFSFLRNFHIVFHSGYTKLHSHQRCVGFPFLHTLPTFVICALFDDCCSDWCEVISHCGFDWRLPDD